MEPNKEQPPETNPALDPATQDLARRLDRYVETHFRSMTIPAHVKLMMADRITRLTGSLDELGATVSVTMPLQQVRQTMLEALVTGYTLSRLEQRFFLEQNLEPADAGDREPPTGDPGSAGPAG